MVDFTRLAIYTISSFPASRPRTSAAEHIQHCSSPIPLTQIMISVRRGHRRCLKEIAKGGTHGNQTRYQRLAASVYRIQISNSSIGIMNLSSINLFPQHLTRQSMLYPDRHAESNDGFASYA